ncbi:MAG: hypothetical protein QM820_44410 [Minicystis sp.]
MPAFSRLALLSVLLAAGCATVVDSESSTTSSSAGSGGASTSSSAGTGGGATTSSSTGGATTSSSTGTGGQAGGAPCATWSWTRATTGFDATNLVAIDPATGDIFAAGYFTDTIDDGSGPVETENGWDAFLVRFKPTGEIVWSRAFGGKGSDEITTLAVDPSGDIVIGGSFTESISFGGPTLTTTTQFTMFLARLDAGGNHVWSRSLGYPVGAHVAIDPAGDIVLAGNFMGTLDLGGGPLIATKPPPGSFGIPVPDIFLAKLTATGAHVWSKRFGDPSVELADHVAVAPDGTIAVTGLYDSANLDFGGGALPFNKTPGLFLATFDPAGHLLWSKGFLGPPAFSPPDTLSPIDARALAVAPGGDILLAGDFMGVTDFGAGTLTTADPLDRNLFVTRFDASGGVLWTRQFTDQSGDQDIAGGTLDAAGRFTFTGLFRGSIDFGGGSLASTADERDIFVAQLDAAGNHTWSAGYGGPGLDRGFSVAVDGTGSVFLGGTYTQTLPLGCTSLTGAGELDAFVARIDP